MAVQTIGTVRVQVGQSVNPRVSSVSYGIRALKNADDLDIRNAEDGDVLVYKADTNSFAVEPVAAPAPQLDAGLF
jgi:hypothetical protein